MDTLLTPLHSIFRWLVLSSVLYSIGKSYLAYNKGLTFTTYDNQVRSLTTIIVHIQLIIGMILYIKSPVTSYFWKNINQSYQHIDILFYGALHPLLMLLAVVLITVGSSLAKRQQIDRKKHKTLLIWFSIALVIIFFAIPWPFSFLSQRPYIRGL